MKFRFIKRDAVEDKPAEVVEVEACQRCTSILRYGETCPNCERADMDEEVVF